MVESVPAGTLRPAAGGGPVDHVISRPDGGIGTSSDGDGRVERDLPDMAVGIPEAPRVAPVERLGGLACDRGSSRRQSTTTSPPAWKKTVSWTCCPSQPSPS